MSVLSRAELLQSIMEAGNLSRESHQTTCWVKLHGRLSSVLRALICFLSLCLFLTGSVSLVFSLSSYSTLQPFPLFLFYCSLFWPLSFFTSSCSHCITLDSLTAPVLSLLLAIIALFFLSTYFLEVEPEQFRKRKRKQFGILDGM